MFKSFMNSDPHYKPLSVNKSFKLSELQIPYV